MIARHAYIVVGWMFAVGAGTTGKSVSVLAANVID